MTLWRACSTRIRMAGLTPYRPGDGEARDCEYPPREPSTLCSSISMSDRDRAIADLSKWSGCMVGAVALLSRRPLATVERCSVVLCASTVASNPPE